MCWSLKNKIVVITGGAQGIGFEIAEKYLQQDAKTIIILDVNENVGTEAVQILNSKYGNNKAVFIKCDVTSDVDDVSKEIFESYRIDVLINSAGIVNEAMPKKTIDVNLIGTIDWSFKLWQHMRKDRGGCGGTIVNLSSAHCFHNNPLLPSYNASKYAVIGFTKSLGHSVNYERSGVRVVAICPGATDTTLRTSAIPFDEELTHISENYSTSLLWQKVDIVGDAAVEIYQTADSGTVWLIEDAKPVTDITQ